MIPILSSTLIAVTPYNGSIQENNTTIVNQNPSSIILAEKDTSVFPLVYKGKKFLLFLFLWKIPRKQLRMA